jgi:hypothetical protein
MPQQTYIPRLGQDADFAALTVTSLIINGQEIEATSILLGSGEVVDLNGEADALILDAAQNVRLDGSSVGKLRVKISGAYDFEIAANVLTALSGSSIATNTIAETTAASGVTIDGVLLKDGGAVFADAATIEVDTVNEATSAAGVTIDGALLKDGRSNLGRQVQALTASGAITIKSGLVTLAHDTVVIAATLAAPVAGDELFIVDASAAGTAAHTVTTAAGVTFHGGTNNTATLNAPGEALHMIAISATVWFILENIGSVALSEV